MILFPHTSTLLLVKYKRVVVRRKVSTCVTFSDSRRETDSSPAHVQGDTKKRELLKNPTKIEEIQEKKIIDRN